MDNRRIGVFDSGLGGLTVVKELRESLPLESIIYFGDTGRVPYGTKSQETIIRYTKSDINFLKTFDLKLIVAACGTASSLALPHLEQDTYVPVIGVVEATVHAAVEKTKNKKIGVIATPGTISSDAYGKLIHKSDDEIEVINKACPLFVPLVENGYTEGEVPFLVACDYLEPLKKSGVDTIILGCTHYPLLAGVIKKVMGDGVSLINSGRETAKYIKSYIEENDMESCGDSEGKYRYFVSDEPSMFSELSAKFLGCETREALEKIDIEKY